MRNLEIYDRKPTKAEIELALTGEDVSPDWWRDALDRADSKDLTEIRLKQSRGWSRFESYTETEL